MTPKNDGKCTKNTNTKWLHRVGDLEALAWKADFLVIVCNMKFPLRFYELLHGFRHFNNG